MVLALAGPPGEPRIAGTSWHCHPYAFGHLNHKKESQGLARGTQCLSIQSPKPRDCSSHLCPSLGNPAPLPCGCPILSLEMHLQCSSLPARQSQLQAVGVGSPALGSHRELVASAPWHPHRAGEEHTGDRHRGLGASPEPRQGSVAASRQAWAAHSQRKACFWHPCWQADG